MSLKTGCLVLYKAKPARVEQLGDKITIALPEGGTVNVRPKDVELLHPGPVADLRTLHAAGGDIETAWELVTEQSIDLAELSDLIFGAYTPATAWTTWALVADGLYFEGTPTGITGRSADAVAQTQESREAKAAAEQAWSDFVARAQKGQLQPDDDNFLREVEDVALGKRNKSRVLRELGEVDTPQNAHAVLLRFGYWSEAHNPYPDRLLLPTSPPTLNLPSLPNEPRLDLTHLPAFAIDDAGNQDPDDALSLDGSRLWVHIADVGALVSPDSPADLEARARGATLYLPTHAVPMLPRAAVDQLGLGLHDTSPALSFGLDLDAAGEIVNVEVVASWVRVTRLTYEAVEARLDAPPFAALNRIAQTQESLRNARDAAQIDLPEVKVSVDAQQRVQLRPILPLNSRAIVREAMLVAGQGVAQFARQHELPFPFTTQDVTPATITETGLAGMLAIRKTLQRSQMKTTPGPHAGLGLTMYAQVTSPLRRYLDLVAHQQLRAYINQQPLLTESEILARVGAAEAVSGNVRQAERLSREHWTLVYLRQNADWLGEGIVVEKRDKRSLVLIPELGWESMMHLRQNVPLNDSVTVKVHTVDLPHLGAYFQHLSDD